VNEQEIIHFHKPHIALRILERAGIREVTIFDITPRGQKEALFSNYPDLVGDQTMFGDYDLGGNC